MKPVRFCFALLFLKSALVFAGPEPIPSSDKEMKATVAPAPECDYTWTGFYIGAHGGYGWSPSNIHFNAEPTVQRFFAVGVQDLDTNNDGFFGGGQLGYNYQWHKWVFGVETDFSGADFSGGNHRSPIPQVDGSLTQGILTAHEDTDWFGTARLRFGYAAACRLLIYGTGGLAYGHTNYFANTDFLNNVFYTASADQTNVGWTVGGGLEYALSHHWSIKGEYLYYDLGNQGFTGNDSTGGTFFHVRYDAQTREHTVNLGLNFKF